MKYMITLNEKIRNIEDRFNKLEANILSFVPENHRFDRLQKEAAALEARFPDPARRSPLFGVLVGVKDIFRVNGFPTRCGSRLPPDVLAGEESAAVSRLKALGALIVGKTVTTEFAYFGPGPTRNPHNPAHTPGGSSSGSAAASAAGLCEIAFGTQTIGSVNRPAAFCGTHGYKPSFDRIAKRGVIPLAGSLDHVGLIGEDLSLIETAAAALNRGWQANRGPNKPRFAIPTGPYLERAEKEALDHLAAVSESLKRAGFEVFETEIFMDFQAIYDRHQLVLAAEAARVHAAWYAAYADLYHFKTAELIAKGSAISDETLASAVAEIPVFREMVDRMMDALRIDAWLTPSAPGPAPLGLESTGDPVMNLPWTQSGLPTLTIPTGRASNGLPLGTQLVGRWYRDEALFNHGSQAAAVIGTDLSLP